MASDLAKRKTASELLSHLAETSQHKEPLRVTIVRRASIRANQLQVINPLETRCY